MDYGSWGSIIALRFWEVEITTNVIGRVYRDQHNGRIST